MRVGSRHMGFYRWPGLGQRHAPFASQLTLSHRLPGGSLPLIRANPPHTRVSRSSPVVQDDARRACFWGLASFLSGPSPGAGAVWQRERLAICHASQSVDGLFLDAPPCRTHMSQLRVLLRSIVARPGQAALPPSPEPAGGSCWRSWRCLRPHVRVCLSQEARAVSYGVSHLLNGKLEAKGISSCFRHDVHLFEKVMRNLAASCASMKTFLGV